MADLVRLSFSLEQPLYEKLEELVERERYTNRSEFIRDLIRRELVAEEWRGDEEVVGTITLVYDHHAHQLSDQLTHIQHDHHEAILATTHVHLDSHLCAEMILVRGRASQIRQIADLLKQHRGILHAELSVSSTGRELK